MALRVLGSRARAALNHSAARRFVDAARLLPAPNSGFTPSASSAAVATLERMTGPQIHPRELRVSDAERAHTLRLLERATGRGYIDIGEFSDRSSRVMAARTRADLNLLLLDLPGLQLSGRPFDPTAPAPAPADAPRMPGDVLALKGYGSRQFTGNWTVPSLITVEGVGAGTKLDFTQARLTTPQVTIEFRSNFGGTAHLRVPVGTVVRYDGLDLRGCSVHDSVPAPAPVPGADRPPPLSLNLVGVKRYGSIHVRQPRTNTLKKLVGDIVDGWR
jgi:hypothetical protein